MSNLLEGLAYTALFIALILLPHAFAYALIPERVQGGLSFTECITEDSTNCVWNATIHGNGQGNSFIDVNGTAYYFGMGE